MRGPISRRAFVCGAAGLTMLSACSSRTETSTESADANAAQESSQEEAKPAEEEKTFPEQPLRTFDMHADTIDTLGMVSHMPYAGFDTKHSGTLASNDAEVAADRMGAMQWAQCYAIWLPDYEGEYTTDISHIEWYREGVKWFKSQMEQLGDRFEQVRHFGDIPSILEAGKVAAILTVENAACLDVGLEVVDEFAEDGVLIAGVTWNGRNALGSGNDFVDDGLTDLGKRYIAALEEHGIVADVSHLNEKGFWELDAIATRPYIATHSNSRVVCNHLRNLTDDQFKALIERGGVVGLNFNEGFVHEGTGGYTVDELAAHVEHWLDLGGEDAIALGGDRDGADIPAWIANCSSQVDLYGEFCDRLGEDITRKLFFDNALRFFKRIQEG